MRKRIADELDTLIAEHDIRIPLAVESGSRAWGFASPDSDFDLRFLYVHRVDWYLTVKPQRDSIEAMLPGDLDLKGWELRKTLDLFAGCNCGLNEWLGSPIIYRESGDLAATLRSLIPAYFNPIKAIHHYRSIAAGTRDRSLDGETIGIKKLFYIMRPLMACEWIEQHGTQPSTAFDDLLAADLVPAEIRRHIDDFLNQKVDAAEGHVVPVPADLLTWINARIDHHSSCAERTMVVKTNNRETLDAILRQHVLAE